MSTKTKEAVAGKGAGKGKGTGKGKVQAAPAVECKHPEETAFNREREDGSGKWDRVCGVEGCGFVMCEVGKPKDAVDQGAGMEEAVQKAEEDLGLAAPAPGETAADIVITPKEEIQGAPVGNLYEQVQAELAAEGASLDETTGEVVEKLPTSEGVDRSEDQAVAEAMGKSEDGASEIAHGEVKPDKVGKPFLKYLRVDVPEHRLAEYAKRQAELFNFWNETQVAKKKAAKAYKEDIERTEEELTTIAEVIADGAEEVQISCRWEYDYRHGVKYLRRLDTKEIADTVTLTPEECQFSFNLDADEEAEQVEETPSGEVQEAPCATCPDHPEGCGHSPEDKQDCVDAMSEPWARNDERTQALLEMAGVKIGLELLSQQSEEHLKEAEDWALAFTSAEEGVTVPDMPQFVFDAGSDGLPAAVGVDLAAGPEQGAVVTMEAGKVVDITHTLDVNRRCCLPPDRATAVIDGVETLYCCVCGLVQRKRKADADPWDNDLDFEIGEKVDLAGLA